VAGGDLARIAFWGMSRAAKARCKTGAGDESSSWSGLAQPELQAVHRLQWIRLLIDKKKEQLVCHLRQDAFGAATDLTLAYLPLPVLADGYNAA